MPCVCAVQVECEHQLEMERDRWVSVGVCGGVGVCFKIVFGGKAGGSVCVCMIVCGGGGGRWVGVALIVCMELDVCVV